MNFAFELAKLARQDDLDNNIPVAEADGAYNLLYRSLGQRRQTFLGKEFVVLWPDGEPPVLSAVLRYLVEGWNEPGVQSRD